MLIGPLHSHQDVKFCLNHSIGQLSSFLLPPYSRQIPLQLDFRVLRSLHKSSVREPVRWFHFLQSLVHIVHIPVLTQDIHYAELFVQWIDSILSRSTRYPFILMLLWFSTDIYFQ